MLARLETCLYHPLLSLFLFESITPGLPPHNSKGFAEDEIIVGIGVTLSEEKVRLGFIQATSDSNKVIRTCFLDVGV